VCGRQVLRSDYKNAACQAPHLVPRSSPFVEPFIMDAIKSVQTQEPSKSGSDENTATAAAIEDVQSRILHGKQLALVIAYVDCLTTVSPSTEIP
jgi:hypothetical protein